MDEVDFAQQNEDRLLKAQIRRHRENNIEKANKVTKTIKCIDCEETIPEARRKVMPGCERCVTCQTIYETRGCK